MVINSKEMTTSIPDEKLQKVKLQCLDLYQSPQVSILQLTKVLGHLTSIIQTFLPPRLNSRFLQQQQIQILKENKSCLANITLNNNSKQELLLWIQNLKIFNETSLLKQAPQVVLHACGCFIDRMGCSSPRKINRKNMVISRKEMAYQRVGTTSSKARPPDIS